MVKRTTAALFLLMLSGCGGNYSPSPSPTPTPGTFTLTGQVTNSATGAGVPGATVSVVDGANAGKSATTDGSGNYSLAGLQQSGFTARAHAQYYDEFSRGVTLTSNQAVSFSLAPIPAFSKSGVGDARFDMPATVTRVRIQATYQGDNQDFVVHFSGYGVVGVTLGTSYTASGTSYDSTQSATPPGTPSGTPAGVVEIVNSAGVLWSFTEVR